MTNSRKSLKQERVIEGGWAALKSLNRMCKPDFPALQSTPLDCHSRQICRPYVGSAMGTVTQYILRYPLWSSYSEPEGSFSCLRLLLTMMSIFTHCDLHFFSPWILNPERDYFYLLLFDSAKAQMQNVFLSCWPYGLHSVSCLWPAFCILFAPT